MLRIKPSVAIIVLFSLLWWLATWVWPSPLNADQPPVRQLLALMGLGIMVCAFVLYSRNHAGWNCLLLFYGCAAAVHWAGPLGNNQGSAGVLLLAIYVTFAVALFGSLFLHLALIYPNEKLKRPVFIIVYLPALGASCFFAFLSIGIFEENVIPLLFVLGSLYGVIGGVFWIYRFWFDSSGFTDRRSATALTLALLFGYLPNVFEQYGVITLDQYAGITNLSLLFVLAALSWLSLRIDPAND